MKILNYTPHAITFKAASQTFEIQSVGVARATTESKLVGFIDDLPIMQKSFGKVYGLPDPNLIDENTILIVSSLTAQAAKAENHPLLGKMYIVNDTLRDANGRITAIYTFHITPLGWCCLRIPSVMTFGAYTTDTQNGKLSQDTRRNCAKN